MAITTRNLGRIGNDNFVFGPEVGVRYYLPKDTYTFLIVANSKQDEYTLNTNLGVIYGPSAGSSRLHRENIEWFEFLNATPWRIAVIRGNEGYNKIPSTTPIN